MRKSRADGKVEDWRSTGRRRARGVLFHERVDYACVGYNDPTTSVLVPCSKTSLAPPKDAPKWFEELWPEQNRCLSSPLQADHLDKDVTHNSIENVVWRCPSCHKLQDQQTGKGTAQESNPHGYDLASLDALKETL